jgi:adenylate cyclase
MGSGGGVTTQAQKHRLAVLPLTNISAGSRDEYFVDGMTEELISTLSKITGLSVIARTSAMHYKSTDKTIAQVASELAVRTVVEGSVRKSGHKLRIAVRLVDAATQEDLWSENYDRELKDVFAIQRDIAQRIGRALKLRLERREEPGLESRSTPVVNAHDLYCRDVFSGTYEPRLV